jgi:hypothetical protein
MKTKRKKARKTKASRRDSATVELRPNEIKIRYDHPRQVLPKLLELARHFSDDHQDVLARIETADGVLGGAMARVIVSGCANSNAWDATLSELGLSRPVFRDCVVGGVDRAGYVSPDDIPAEADTKLIEVVAAIQGSPHK